jgi:hypothetical protein
MLWQVCKGPAFDQTLRTEPDDIIFCRRSLRPQQLQHTGIDPVHPCPAVQQKQGLAIRRQAGVKAEIQPEPIVQIDRLGPRVIGEMEAGIEPGSGLVCLVKAIQDQKALVRRCENSILGQRTVDRLPKVLGCPIAPTFKPQPVDVVAALPPFQDGAKVQRAFIPIQICRRADVPRSGPAGTRSLYEPATVPGSCPAFQKSENGCVLGRTIIYSA